MSGLKHFLKKKGLIQIFLKMVVFFKNFYIFLTSEKFAIKKLFLIKEKTKILKIEI